jgi:hypothetical protein
MQSYMAEQYVQTLIPKDAQYAPKPEQIICFCDGLTALGAAPLNLKLWLMKPSGRLRPIRNPLTGEITKSIPAYDRVTLESTASLVSTIGAFQQYIVALEGQGPPTLPPFELYLNDAPFTGSYGFIVRCRLQNEPVSMSDLAGEQTGDGVPSFGEPCGTHHATGLFRHPVTSERIEVANAGCARFCLEFEFGKWLLPKIANSLNILDSAIVGLANDSFGLEFAQGCHLL